jgi:cell division protein FtsQ
MRRLIDALLKRRPKKAKRFKAGWADFLPPRWRRRATIACLALIGSVAAGLGLHRALKSEALGEVLAQFDDAIEMLAVESGFVVRSVAVEGLSEARREEVLAALAIEIGEPILGIDPAAARARLERVGWIKSASVGRRLDGAVDVRIEERKPFALWQKEGRLFLVDRDGTPITDERLGRFAHLPLVVGEDAARHAAQLLDALAQETVLYPQVAAAIRVGGRRWTLRLANGLEILLPEDDPAQAWERLARLEREHNLLGRSVSAIDLRLPDRVILRLAPGTVLRARDGGQQT